MFKKFISFLLTIVFSFSLISSVFAENNDFMTLDEFNSLKEEGYIGEDISYEDLKELNVESKKLEKYLENSDLFEQVPFSTDYLYSGDIIITNATSSEGLTGHAAIALNEYEIIHIRGPKYTPQVISPQEFKNLYSDGWIKVYRPKENIGRLAAQWVDRTYRNSGATYMITTNLASTNVTYCSKMVWQGYYFGVDKEVMPPTLQTTNNIITPYGLMEGLNDGSYTFNYLGAM